MFTNNLTCGQIGIIRRIGADIYTADAITPTGENIYLSMEPLGEDKEKWNKYINTISCLVNGGNSDIGTIGGLIEICNHINDPIALKEFLATRSIPDFWTSDPSKFEQLCIKMRERPKIRELLSVIPHASRGVNVNKQTHMIYASKTPITGLIKFNSTSQNKGFGAIVDYYGDLIMSVGVTINDIVENRGILRNLLNIIDGGFCGISMMIHCFTCMIIQEYYPFINTFKVRPLKKMGETFINSLPKDQITINGIAGEIYHEGFETEKDILVPVDVLANLYKIR